MFDEPDAEWVAQCLRGDTSAFELLVAKHHKVVFNVALRMVGDYEEARDVTQATFAKAWEKLATFDPSHRFFSWLYRIMINHSLDLIERRRRQVPLDRELPSSTRPDRDFEADERAEWVHKALARLPRASREVLVLRHFTELSYQEIAEALKVPEKTVKSRLFEARQKLGEILGAEGGRSR
jgi:RNA polymerase sigma-70 factor (ECF subfamily)